MTTKAIKAAMAHVRKSDRRMAKLMDAVGSFPELSGTADPFRALLGSIVSQQISTKAAASIYKRVVALAPGRRQLRPSDILSMAPEALRGAGLSGAKTAAVIDLATKADAGELPTSRSIKSMDDEDIIQALVQVRGIGRWSVEMLLIFHLGRLDVLPSTDFGVRKGFAKTYGAKKLPTAKDELPTAKAILAYGDKWRPFRTIPSWYLWRALEL